MDSLLLSIKNALDLSGNSSEANKAYLEFIKANFMIPIEKNSSADPQVLFLYEAGHAFLPVFSEARFFDAWAQDIKEEIQVLRLSGVDLLKGIGEETTICLNIGSTLYKEFNSAEIARMRGIVLKFFKKD